MCNHVTATQPPLVRAFHRYSMKRPLQKNEKPLTTQQPAVIGHSFEPVDLTTEKQLLEYLLYMSDIALNMTQPFDLDSFTQSHDDVFTNPLALDYHPEGDAKKEAQWTPAYSENFGHFPLIAIGEGHSNHSFCRVSVQTGDYGTLYVSFRPFIMAQLSELFRARGVFGALQNFRGRAALTGVDTDHEHYTLTNLLYLMNVVSDKRMVEIPTPQGPVDLGAGYVDLLTRTLSKVVLENDFRKLVAQEEDPGVRRMLAAQAAFLKTQRLSTTHNTTGVGSVVNTLADFIAAYNPDSVIFNGFSLGAGSSTAAAVLCHILLSQKLPRQTLPRFHCLALAGTMVGGPRLRAYVQHNFHTCLGVKVVGTLAGAGGGIVTQDPVSQMPFSSQFCHVGRMLVADYNTKTIQDDTEAAGIQNRAMPAWALMLSQVKVPGGSLLSAGVSRADHLLATAFDKIHMTGEDMIPRITALAMLRKGIKSPLLNSITCSWFTGSGTAAKYGICYEDSGLCSLDDIEEAMAKRAKGDNPATGRKRRSACMRTSLAIPVAVNAARARARKTYKVKTSRAKP